MPNQTETQAGSRPGSGEDERRAVEDTQERLRRSAEEAQEAIKEESSKLRDDVSAEAKAQAESLKERAGAEAERQRVAIADHIGAFASALRAGVDALESEGRNEMAGYWRTAADSAGRLAERVKDKPLAEAWQEAEDYVREEPALGFGGAMVAGFMLARFLKSSRPEEAGPEHGYGIGVGDTGLHPSSREPARTPAGTFAANRPQA
jgi:hypothetical protein